jgi:hypothetical protein
MALLALWFSALHGMPLAHTTRLLALAEGQFFLSAD